MSKGIKDIKMFNLFTDIIETLKFRGTIFFSSDLSAPWGISLEKRKYPRFHIALKGTLYVGADSTSNVKANEMDIFMLPKGDSHWIADNPGNKKLSSSQAVDACELGSPLFQIGPNTHRIMCGLVEFDEGLTHPILDALPTVIHVQNVDHNSIIWQLIMLIDQEIRENGIHQNPSIDKLTEVLFLKILIQFFNENTEKYSFLRAIHDKRIHQALMLMHQNPQHDWTLEELGSQIGMSKATLVRHFQDALNMAPIAYLNHWRRLKAYNAIRYTNDSMDKIAVSLGFTSGRTLSRALIRELGMTPAEIRHKQKREGV
ncbi:AraC family transcriptional regulator [Enterovibrio makurazakiensis]|uniref:cupin domain-containing protein n=1 Tax=Enterovibrio makurazakiensis TaxID=2910232 RepID=UPI003D1B894E